MDIEKIKSSAFRAAISELENEYAGDIKIIKKLKRLEEKYKPETKCIDLKISEGEKLAKKLGYKNLDEALKQLKKLGVKVIKTK